jgi:heat-inducible transcriptional repressor
MERSTETNRISERQRQILSIIIEEYVTSARPVASEHLVSRYGLNVSSATVRNDMAELERAGLIMQPHTSAGRVPSDRGYRYFVENLMSPTALPADEQRKISHQFHQVEMEADEWVRLAAAVLARSVHIAALATTPRSTAVRLKHFELLAISDTRIMIVLVGHDGAVSQQMVTVGESWEQADLSSLSAQLNGQLEGKTADEIRDWAKVEANVANLPPITPTVLDGVATLLGKLERPEASQVYHDGLAHILEQPEFRDRERMQRILDLFENGAIWSSIIPSIMGQEGVQVIIGDEGWGEGMEQCSVVLARYGLGDRLAGVLGVVGPLRMPYSRSVSTVGYMSRLLSDMLRKAYDPETDGEQA